MSRHAGLLYIIGRLLRLYTDERTLKLPGSLIKHLAENVRGFLNTAFVCCGLVAVVAKWRWRWCSSCNAALSPDHHGSDPVGKTNRSTIRFMVN